MRITEHNVIGQLQLNNPLALEYIIDTYGSAVYGLIQQILRGAAPQDVEECVSDVFVAAWQKSSRYNPRRGSLKTWLLVIAKHTALDYRRKLAKHSAPGQITDFPESGPGVEEAVLDKEDLEQVLASVEKLPKQDRSIFYRRYVLYQDVVSIAKSLGMSRGAVDTRLWRMRRLLRQTLLGREELI